MKAVDQKLSLNQKSRKRIRSLLLWMLPVLVLPLTGCPKRQGPEPRIRLPKSSKPVVRVLEKRGRFVRYKIYNTSSRTFRGLAVVLSGLDCDGKRSRRIWIKNSRPYLRPGYGRELSSMLSRFCRRVEVNAYDRIFFITRIRRHKPYTRYHYNPDERTVTYKIFNRSILPFRGLAIAIQGYGCMGQKPKKLWLKVSKSWLFPGYARTFQRRIPLECGDIKVAAFDLISFRIKLRKAILRRRLMKQRRYRRQPHYNPRPTKPPPQGGEI